MASVWSTILQGAGNLLGGVLQSGGMYPGGAPTYPPPIVAMPGGAMVPGFNLDAITGGGGGLAAPFTARGTPRLHVMTSPTGRVTWFRPAGRPVLFSGDFAACKRVRKVAGKARRRMGGR